MIENDKGKKMPQKIGLKPEQREGMEYEFTSVLDLSLEEGCLVPTAETGKELLE